ncbi:hypothetical protein MKS88_005466 [Plasmodium brasilianum]|uniref:Uncharacterized protein n=1 Tax=Plasmodium brasilianum TaxID=5824 RepID=A0ACB9Y3L3_PLABR|nr:hypothetical protein MKS88_005466 [Plasmodium brasilianum]
MTHSNTSVFLFTVQGILASLTCGLCCFIYAYCCNSKHLKSDTNNKEERGNKRSISKLSSDSYDCSTFKKSKVQTKKKTEKEKLSELINNKANEYNAISLEKKLNCMEDGISNAKLLKKGTTDECSANGSSENSHCIKADQEVHQENRYNKGASKMMTHCAQMINSNKGIYNKTVLNASNRNDSSNRSNSSNINSSNINSSSINSSNINSSNINSSNSNSSNSNSSNSNNNGNSGSIGRSSSNSSSSNKEFFSRRRKNDLEEYYDLNELMNKYENKSSAYMEGSNSNNIAPIIYNEDRQKYLSNNNNTTHNICSHERALFTRGNNINKNTIPFDENRNTFNKHKKDSYITNRDYKKGNKNNSTNIVFSNVCTRTKGEKSNNITVNNTTAGDYKSKWNSLQSDEERAINQNMEKTNYNKAIFKEEKLYIKKEEENTTNMTNELMADHYNDIITKPNKKKSGHRNNFYNSRKEYKYYVNDCENYEDKEKEINSMQRKQMNNFISPNKLNYAYAQSSNLILTKYDENTLLKNYENIFDSLDRNMSINREVNNLENSANIATTCTNINSRNLSKREIERSRKLPIYDTYSSSSHTLDSSTSFSRNRNGSNQNVLIEETAVVPAYGAINMPLYPCERHMHNLGMCIDSSNNRTNHSSNHSSNHNSNHNSNYSSNHSSNHNSNHNSNHSSSHSSSHSSNNGDGNICRVPSTGSYYESKNNNSNDTFQIKDIMASDQIHSNFVNFDKSKKIPKNKLFYNSNMESLLKAKRETSLSLGHLKNEKNFCLSREKISKKDNKRERQSNKNSMMFYSVPEQKHFSSYNSNSITTNTACDIINGNMNICVNNNRFNKIDTNHLNGGSDQRPLERQLGPSFKRSLEHSLERPSRIGRNEIYEEEEEQQQEEGGREKNRNADNYSSCSSLLKNCDNGKPLMQKQQLDDCTCLSEYTYENYSFHPLEKINCSNENYTNSNKYEYCGICPPVNNIIPLRNSYRTFEDISINKCKRKENKTMKTKSEYCDDMFLLTDDNLDYYNIWREKIQKNNINKTNYKSNKQTMLESFNSITNRGEQKLQFNKYNEYTHAPSVTYNAWAEVREGEKERNKMKRTTTTTAAANGTTTAAANGTTTTAANGTTTTAANGTTTAAANGTTTTAANGTTTSAITATYMSGGEEESSAFVHKKETEEEFKKKKKKKKDKLNGYKNNKEIKDIIYAYLQNSKNEYNMTNMNNSEMLIEKMVNKYGSQVNLHKDTYTKENKESKKASSKSTPHNCFKENLENIRTTKEKVDNDEAFTEIEKMKKKKNRSVPIKKMENNCEQNFIQHMQESGSRKSNKNMSSSSENENKNNSIYLKNEKEESKLCIVKKEHQNNIDMMNQTVRRSARMKSKTYKKKKKNFDIDTYSKYSSAERKNKKLKNAEEKVNNKINIKKEGMIDKNQKIPNLQKVQKMEKQIMSKTLPMELKILKDKDVLSEKYKLNVLVQKKQNFDEYRCASGFVNFLIEHIQEKTKKEEKENFDDLLKFVLKLISIYKIKTIDFIEAFLILETINLTVLRENPIEEWVLVTFHFLKGNMINQNLKFIINSLKLDNVIISNVTASFYMNKKPIKMTETITNRVLTILSKVVRRRSSRIKIFNSLNGEHKSKEAHEEVELLGSCWQPVNVDGTPEK